MKKQTKRSALQIATRSELRNSRARRSLFGMRSSAVALKPVAGGRGMPLLTPKKREPKVSVGWRLPAELLAYYRERGGTQHGGLIRLIESALTAQRVLDEQ